MTAETNMNFLTLQFDGELERDFLKDYFHKFLQQVRFALLAGTGVYATYGILDALMVPEEKYKLWFIRYVIVCPLLLGIFCFSYSRQFRKFMQASISLAVLLAGFSIMLMPVIVREPNYLKDIYVALMLLIMATYTFTKLRFAYASLTCWIIVGTYEIVAIWVENFPLAKLLSINFGLVSANFIGMFASYLLEQYIRRDFLQNRLLKEEREKSERLILNILPAAIACQLKEDHQTLADHFPEATVLFADIVGFTSLSTRIAPIQMVGMLNEIFSAFDGLAEKHGLEKIKTIGDAYMVVGGLPIPRPDHVEAIAEMALDMQQAISDFNTSTGEPFSIRIGINTGPVVAGVIGIKKFIYDLWGDTVNTASRMESHGIPGSIQVTEETYKVLQDKYIFQERGAIHVKGKGEMHTYFLKRRKVHATLV
ncbi:hypothetical protein H6F77_11095 [Microcoleus sp. FACHB-831]|nr:adenylate cyclase [Microcoleus sp. FACHB-831]MBD1921638.1 hypothetical protein [Microcoleus sp. FACHB-831]